MDLDLTYPRDLVRRNSANAGHLEDIVSKSATLGLSSTLLITDATGHSMFKDVLMIPQLQNLPPPLPKSQNLPPPKKPLPLPKKPLPPPKKPRPLVIKLL